jgi:hypothetical protein
MTQYQFIRGLKEFDEDAITAQDAGDELARIQAEHGSLTPQTVVDESRPDDAPLHPAFEWDDSVASERYRHIQASDLIKTVEVIQPTTDEPKSEPAYVSVDRPSRQYQRTVEVVKSPELFESAFLQACERLRAAERAVEQLQQIAKRERPEVYKECGRAVYVLKQLQTMLPRRSVA